MKAFVFRNPSHSFWEEGAQSRAVAEEVMGSATSVIEGFCGRACNTKLVAFLVLVDGQFESLAITLSTTGLPLLAYSRVSGRCM